LRQFLTRYSRDLGVYGTTVVSLSSVCPSVTDVLWLNGKK